MPLFKEKCKWRLITKAEKLRSGTKAVSEWALWGSRKPAFHSTYLTYFVSTYIEATEWDDLCLVILGTILTIVDPDPKATILCFLFKSLLEGRSFLLLDSTMSYRVAQKLETLFTPLWSQDCVSFYGFKRTRGPFSLSPKVRDDSWVRNVGLAEQNFHLALDPDTLGRLNVMTS